MPEPITNQERKKLTQTVVSNPDVILLEVNEEGFDHKIRVCAHDVNITHEGNEYIAAPFTINMIGSGEEEIRSQLEFPNIDRSLAVLFRTVKRLVQVRMILVNVSESNIVLFDTRDLLVLRSPVITSESITCQLQVKHTVREPSNQFKVEPRFFPGVDLQIQ